MKRIANGEAAAQGPRSAAELKTIDAYWRAANYLYDLDRFHLVIDVMVRVPKMAERAPELKRMMADKLSVRKAYITPHGCDMPEVAQWQWAGS